MAHTFAGRTVLVTGGTGTIGSMLVQQLLRERPKQIRVLSRDESKQYELMETIKHHQGVRFFIGDIRDRERLDYAFQGVDIVFHAAALKHVPLCEYNPFEAVKTNIVGSQNVIAAALQANVDRVVAISTDKAVNPENVMGVSKLMMEKLIVNANYYRGPERTKFSLVRFGNVAWARGSVFPLWQKQAERNREIHVTDQRMTRFLMSQKQAITLVLKCATIMNGGEVFILKMPSIRLPDLAKIFIAKYFPHQKIRTVVSGKRAGEKTHEELCLPNPEGIKLFENRELLILVPEVNIPDLKQRLSLYPGFKQRHNFSGFSSKDHLDIESIRAII